MGQSNDWSDIFQVGTIFQLHDNGRIAANDVYESPQKIEISSVSDSTDSEGDWPQAVTLEGRRDGDQDLTETPTDNIYVREAIERGDVTVFKQ